MEPSDLQEIRHMLARSFVAGWDKAAINAAVDALDVAFETVKPQLSTAIETAAPGMFDGPQKKLLVAAYILRKAGRELV